MFRYMALLTVSILLTLSFLSYSVFGENLSEASIYVAYDLYANSGIVVYNITYDATLYNALVDIELPIGNATDIVNVTDADGNVLSYTYSAENNTLTVFVNGTDTVSITYMVSNMFDEVSVGLYSAIIDLTMFTGADLRFEIALPGTFNVTSEPEAQSIVYEDGVTRIVLDEPTIYTLTIWETPTTPTLTPTTPTTTTPTTPTTPTPASTPTQTSGVSTTPISPGGGLGGATPLIIIAAVIIVVVIVAIVLAKKK